MQSRSYGRKFCTVYIRQKKKKIHYSGVLVSVHPLWHVLLLVLYVDSAVMPLFCHFVRYVILYTALNNMFSYEMFFWLY